MALNLQKPDEVNQILMAIFDAIKEKRPKDARQIIDDLMSNPKTFQMEEE